jgi:hypothetical protein
MRVAVALVALLVAAPAIAGSKLITESQRKKLQPTCERAWPKATSPSRRRTEQCVQYWLFTYEYSLKDARANLDDSLSMDASGVGGKGVRSRDMERMLRHVEKRYRNHDEDDWIAIRGLEFFRKSATNNIDIEDINACRGDLSCILVDIFAGRSIAKHDFEGLSLVSLWKLRNAVYARHGRKFKHPDLNRLFYQGKKRAGGLLPRKINPRFKDSLLTATDRASVRVIRKLERKR